MIPYAFAPRMSEISPYLFGGHGLLEELDLAACVVGHRKDLVELDLRVHAVALNDAVEPRPSVERPGVLDALPLVDAARPIAFVPDEVLADQALHLAEAGGDLVKVLAARGVVDVRRQFVSYCGGNHAVSPWTRKIDRESGRRPAHVHSSAAALSIGVCEVPV